MLRNSQINHSFDDAKPFYQMSLEDRFDLCGGKENWMQTPPNILPHLANSKNIVDLNDRSMKQFVCDSCSQTEDLEAADYSECYFCDKQYCSKCVEKHQWIDCSECCFIVCDECGKKDGLSNPFTCEDCKNDGSYSEEGSSEEEEYSEESEGMNGK